MEYGIIDNSQEKREAVAEVWLPSKNETEAESVFRLISALPENISLEYFGKGSKRMMLVRGDPADVRRTGTMISAAYPSASLHLLDSDPAAEMKDSANLVTVDYGFSGENYLPLKRYDRYKDYDPVHTVLAGLLELGSDEIMWIRIRLLERRRPEWLDTVLKRVKAEKQRGFVTNASHEKTGDSIGAYTPVEQYRTVDQGKAFMTVLTSIAWVFVLLLYLLQMTKFMLFFLGAALLLTFIRAKMPSELDDPWYRTDIDMVKMKAESQQEFNAVTVRLSAASRSVERSEEIQNRMRSVMNLYSLSGGNSLVPAALHEGCYVPQTEDVPVMEMCDWELASFWHIPWISGSVSPGLIPVRGVEMRCPDADEVAGFCRIGEFTQPNGDTGGVYLNSRMMKHNMFLIGKPGTGKTTLMEHIAKAAIEDPDRDSAVIVIDPHGDMYNRLVGCIPPERIRDVILMDFGDPDYVVPYNPLDVKTSGLSPEKAAQVIVDIGKSLWTTSWGPRMQIPLQRSVLAIAAHNQSSKPGSGADGLSLMGILLRAKDDKRRNYISEIGDVRIRDMLMRYFVHEFDAYKDYMREEIILPVLSKSYRFEENPMLEFFSAPRSVLNLKDIIGNKKILLVNTRMSELGLDLSDFIGSFIISVILKEISRQGENDLSGRIPVQLLIDEFQTYTGVPWQELLAQLRKWGGRTVLGTQSFASMMTEDSQNLPGIIMSGVYSIFSFTVNGEDADYLSRNELSEEFGGPSRDTLISLDPYTCYARIMSRDGKLTRPFFFRTASPVIPDPDIRLDVLDMRAKYARKKKAAVSDAMRYLQQIEKYRFYSSGEVNMTEQSSLGATGSGKTGPADIDTDLKYPDNTVTDEKKIEENESEPEDAQAQENDEADPERDRMLDSKYKHLLNL